MTDEERQRAMDFIAAQQAKHAVESDQLLESQRKAELRFERDEYRLGPRRANTQTDDQGR